MRTTLKDESNNIPNKLSKRTKIMIIILVLCFLAAATTITILLMKHYDPQVEIIHSTRVFMPDGSQLALYTLALIDRRVIGEN